jgi:hypothetical protein
MNKLTQLILFLSIVTLWSCNQKPVPDVINLSEWKFKTGDSLNWAKPDYNDASWDTLAAGIMWEAQGYAGYDGYAWYRLSFNLPNEMLNQAYFKDSLIIDLGKIDDTDETFLNGHLIGKNGISVAENDNSKFEGDRIAYSKPRLYILPTSDIRILWGKTNTIAVRVHDHGGGGGFSIAKMYVSLRNLNDYLVINDVKSVLQLKNNQFFKTILIENHNSVLTFSGKLEVTVYELNTSRKLVLKSKEIKLSPGSVDSITFGFKNVENALMVAKYSFTESNGENKFVQSQDFPYILTPKTSETPRINGAKIFGVRPGSPFIFRIPATGVRPMTFEAQNLPTGLTLDSNTGIITGNVNQVGEFKVILVAKNEKGEAKREFRLVVGEKLALTPPMGWNSWNVWGLTVDNEKVKASADAFISSGLADHGYTFINIDDGWEAPVRAKNGEIVTNEKFPDIKATSDYVHSKGLRFGIYSSPGPRTCGGYLGSYQHEMQDAQRYAIWGIDYLKYDWCSYSEVCPDAGKLSEQQKPYILMGKCLKKLSRDIVFSLCQYGMASVWEWGGSVNGNLWRTTGDIEDTWESLSSIGFNQNIPAPYAKPGNWNDPDMLVVGWVGWGPKLHPTRLTASEQYTHISLWSLLSAPLLIGCDLTRLDDFTLNLLTNDEVIDIDQDPLGKSAQIVVKTPQYQVWVKDLEDGSKAIGLFNLDRNEMKISIDWSAVGLKGKQIVRDIWRQKDIGTFDQVFETSVLSHGVSLIKVSKE